MASKRKKRSKKDTSQKTFSCVTASVTVVLVCIAAMFIPLVWKNTSDTPHPDSSTPHPDSSTPHPDSRASETVTVDPNTVKILEQLAYRGDYKAVKTLVEKHKAVNWDDGVLRTPLHYALQGRHDSLSQQPSHLIGQHEEVISYLIEAAHINASQGCPVYYAMHYRNMPALEILLKVVDTQK